jgi:hypothetical protein
VDILRHADAERGKLRRVTSEQLAEFIAGAEERWQV